MIMRKDTELSEKLSTDPTRHNYEDSSDVADQPADASYKAVFINTDGAPAAFLLASNPKMRGGLNEAQPTEC